MTASMDAGACSSTDEEKPSYTYFTIYYPGNGKGGMVHEACLRCSRTLPDYVGRRSQRDVSAERALENVSIRPVVVEVIADHLVM